MASQEDYLDNLLRGMSGEVQPEKEKTVEENIPSEENPVSEPEITETVYEPEATLEPEAESVLPEYEAEVLSLEPEPEAEIVIPEYEAEVSSEPEPEAESVMPEYEAEVTSEPEPEAESVQPEYEAEAALEPELEAEVSLEPELEAESVIPEYEAEVSLEPEYEAESVQPEYEAEVSSEPEPEAESVIPEYEAEVSLESEPEAESVIPEYEAEVSLDSESEAESVMPEYEAEAALELEPEMEPQNGAEEEAAEFEIPDIEELLAGLSENITVGEESPVPESDETMNVEDLLANMREFAGEEEGEPETQNPDMEQVPDLDAVMEMTEDDIARFLSESDSGEGMAAADPSEQDVMDMLEGAADDDLQDIQDMLQKSDNNEPVDDAIVDLLQEAEEDEDDLEEKILSEDGNLVGTGSEEMDALIGDPKKKKALEKKRQKEEKAAAKKAAREAAKAEKAAKKRAKKAKKKRQNKDVLDIPVENALGEELLFDRDELDELVSKAGQVGNEDAETEDDINVPGDADEGAPELDLDALFASSVGSGEAAPEILAANIDEQSASDDPEDAAEKKKEKKVKKESKDKAEKTGFLAKILSFLMEEDEDADGQNENLRLSEENQEILSDLDKEGKAVKGGKGGTGGKKDKKKEKKEKPKKEAKPKKPPKPKAEKPAKEPAPYVPPKRRLTPKKVLPVVLLGITAAASILIFVNVSTDYADKQTAKTAYYNGDYVTCYRNLTGKELNETEKVMYGKSESILYIRLWYREYEMFVEEGDEVRALDSLIQTVKDYPMLYEYASKWNAEGEVYVVYADILNILLDKYGLTELQAKEIAKERNDLEYTRMVVALTQGKAYGSWNQKEPSGGDDSLPHELPEESDLGQGNFVDNR